MPTPSTPPSELAAAVAHETHPRWVVWVTHAAVLPPLPSTIWRLAMSLHLPVGWNQEVPWFAPLYALALGALTEGLALLTIGFVRPWGVIFPRWLPLVGGRRVPPAVAIGPALAAATFLTVAAWQFTVGGRPFGGEEAPSPPLMVASYVPLIAWGPLLALATLGYGLRLRRLRRGGGSGGDQVAPMARRSPMRSDLAG